MSAEKTKLTPQTLSLIIPCYNGAETIGVQLEALARQEWSGTWEVIFVDNGSTDNTMAIVERYRAKLPQLRVVDASARPGQPYALNVGVQAASGEALLFCDADDEVGEGWLAAMAEALSKHDFVACRIDDTKLNAPWLAEGRRSAQSDKLHPLPFAPHIYFAGGGTIGVKRCLLLDIPGGFDERLPAQHDTMVCIQLQLAGHKIHFVPDAVLHLRHRDTFSAIFRQAYNWGKYVPLLYKNSVALGVPKVPHPWKNAINGWRSCVGMMRRARNKAILANAVFRLGWQLGLLTGSITYRVLYI